jgi:3-oxoacyl-[acyl-carrier protein] reductase
MIDPGLEGRVALVTGGNCGIGEAIARGLADQGAPVGITYLRMDPADHASDPAIPDAYGVERARSGEEVAASILDSGGRATALEVDLGDVERIPSLFDHVEQALGPVEILVHNASSWLANTFAPEVDDPFDRHHELVSADSHDRQFSVDARAGAALIAEYSRRHVARGARWGRILAMTSGSTGGFPGEVSYGAAKAALESYVKSAASELGRFGITANIVYPPATDTGWVTESVERAVTAASPLAHVGRPEEVAEVMVFLASEQARFVTGNIVRMH